MALMQRLSRVAFSLAPEPQPAMVSRRQHEERSCRLEFIAHTFYFLPHCFLSVNQVFGT